MDYFAGLFDAEGYISLSLQGNISVGMEMANEPAICLFRDQFGGVVDSRKRSNKRQTWVWRLNTDNVRYFISLMLPHSIIKKPQIQALNSYLDQSREEKRKTRAEFVHLIASLKKPHRGPFINPEHNFSKWLAGMIDGDGNFCIYETIHQRKWIQFQSYIGVFNVFIDPIEYIQRRLPGTMSSLNKSKNPVYKWTPFQEFIPHICRCVLPFLIIKKGQCEALIEYHKMKKPNRFIQYSQEEKEFIRSLITQIKHLNTL